MGIRSRYLWAGLAMALGACVQAPPPSPVSSAVSPGSECRSIAALIAFDFEGAPASPCAVLGERDFAVLVTPEHAPPINPSPWYAFRYESAGDAPVTVTLRYLGGTHRYAPKLIKDGGAASDLPVTISKDGTSATLRLPAGRGTVTAQELVLPGDASADLRRWSALVGTVPFSLGQSHDGRPIEAVRLGRVDAPRLVVLLGRQHPPEVTGAIAMRAFADHLALMFARDPALGQHTQVLIVPQLNPDGVARGHWRANRGAVDLNRDWGEFTQPETRSVKLWLDALPQGVRPVAMIDFHSTARNLFYVQGDEASAAQQRFLASWLTGRENTFAGYDFTIEPRNANPGSGTAKNWFHAVYAIPAYTYEVGDASDRAATRAAAAELAAGLITALDQMAQ
ncbi:MAG: M14 family metallopeptidase [Erythrobacter sp.]|nr:M14 family metallopeptidase [Erythrobacter sp.]